MAQKSNLITLRKNNFINISTQNSKILISLFNFIQNLSFFLIKRQVLLCNSFISVENSVISLDLILFYQQKYFLIKRKSKFLRESKNRIKLVKKGRKKAFISAVLEKFLFSYNLNSHFLKIQILNKFTTRKIVNSWADFLYLRTKKFLNSLFSRRKTLYVDFLYLTVLFIYSKITTKLYINLLGTIFRRLSKKLHNKFIYFIKIVFNFLLKFNSLEEELFAEFKKTSKEIKKLKSRLGSPHKILGLKFIIAGRFRAKDRSKKKLITLGRVPLSSLSKDVDFSSCHVYTVYGAFGLKMWVHKEKV